jgi:DNA repair protein RadD
MALELRYYQRQAIDAIYAYFEKHDGNPLVCMPTGTGKSVVIGAFLQEALTQWPDTRVLVLTHQRELISQNFGALMRAWEDAPAGVYSAGLNRRDINAQILFAGIQSIHGRAYQLQRVDLVLIDEAHLLGKSDRGMYRKLLGQLKEINPDIKIIGLTATPYRADQGMLTDGDDALFSDIAFDLPMLQMIEEGYLTPVVAKATTTQLDTSGVGTRGGEFIASELEAAVDLDHVTSAAVDEIVRAGEARGSWLVFCSGVKHAGHVRDAFLKWGITTAAVTGDTPAPERDRILRDFKAGRLRCVTNMGVLTTGFDAPGVDLIAMLRPTKSIGLYVQMVGRGTRTAPGKDDCLVLDFAGNTMRHGTVDDAQSRVKRKGKADGDGTFPAKTCPKCKTIVPAGKRTCECGHEFPPPIGAQQIDHVPSSAPILTTQIVSEWRDVFGVSYTLHSKPGKPPSLMATYNCGLVSHREWVCLEHGGFPRQKAAQWWTRRARTDVPATVDEALRRAHEIAKPVAISVKPQGQYTEIVGVRFE